MLDNEGAARFLNQCFEIWIKPEIERRKQKGIIPDDFVVLAAEIVISSASANHSVRLNEEMRSSMEVTAVDPAVEMGPGKIISSNQVKVHKIIPPADEIDDAHVILVRIGNVWVTTFDFTYNSGRVAECYKASTEFLASAKDCLELRRFRALIDNLFSSVELLSQCVLQMAPGTTKFSHYSIQQDINLRRKNRAVGGDLAPLLNSLTAERIRARYKVGSYAPDLEQLQKWLEDAEAAVSICKSQIPRRAREAIDGSSSGR